MTANYNDTDDLILLEHQRYMDLLRERNRTLRSEGRADTPTQGQTARFSMKKKQKDTGLRGFYNTENDIQCISRSDIKTETWWQSVWRQLCERVGLSRMSGGNTDVRSREN